MEFSKKFVCECTEYSTYEKNVPAPLFRKSFMLGQAPETAQLLICGLGFYDLFVNGKKITKGYLAPYIANTDHYTYFDRYDLVPYLQAGENVIGVMLGDGHLVGKTGIWDFAFNRINAAPMLALSAEIDCQDEKLRFEADDFVCKKGPAVFNDLRSGVFYDARIEKGWNQTGFNEDGWHKPCPAINLPRGRAKICEADPIKIYREIKPVSIKKGEIEPYTVCGQVPEFFNNLKPFETHVPYEGGYIYDFGENNSGIYRLKIKGTEGQKIDIQCAEQLKDGKLCYSNINFYPDGFSQRDIYWLRGGEEETFEPMFTFHGFRYIYVHGITQEQATEDLLTYLVMSSDLEERGSFECSGERVNELYRMGRRSDRSNFFYFPMDCPHREKNGWTGDASLSAEHMIMTIGAENSWREWLNNIRAAQGEDGRLPGIVPTDTWGYEWGNGPAWDAVLFNLPYFAYKYRGDTRIIEENAGAMLKWLEMITRKRDADGIIEYGLGDWVPAAPPYAALGFTDSTMVLDICRKAEEMFRAIGLELHREFAHKLGQQTRNALRKRYIDPQSMATADGSQTSQAMAIFYDILDEQEKQAGFGVLMERIRAQDYNFTCGCLGTRILFHVLAEFGQAELAYHLITKKEAPSYGYWLDSGDTTFREGFSRDDGYYESSRNHHFHGDVVNWFMRTIGGIQVQNSVSVKIRPHFLREIDWCRVSHKLPAGEIRIRWERTDRGIDLEVRCDDGIRCEIDLDPAMENVRIMKDGKEALQ